MRKKVGFTLMEMLIVIAIVTILVAVAIPVFSSRLDAARERVCQANRRSALAVYRVGQMTGELPEDAASDAVMSYVQAHASSGIVCPAKGTISFQNGQFLCSKHDSGALFSDLSAITSVSRDLLLGSSGVLERFLSAGTTYYDNSQSSIDQLFYASMPPTRLSASVKIGGISTSFYDELAKTWDIAEDEKTALISKIQNATSFRLILTSDRRSAAAVVYKADSKWNFLFPGDEQIYQLSNTAASKPGDQGYYGNHKEELLKIAALKP